MYINHAPIRYIIVIWRYFVMYISHHFLPVGNKITYHHYSKILSFFALRLVIT